MCVSRKASEMASEMWEKISGRDVYKNQEKPVNAHWNFLNSSVQRYITIEMKIKHHMSC